MHELGVLRHAVKTVTAIAEKNNINKIKHITLEVGRESDFVPMFLEKLFPVATDGFPLMKGSIRIFIPSSVVISNAECPKYSIFT